MCESHSKSLRLILLMMVLLLGTIPESSLARQQGLIARYPLNSNPNDTTGNNPPMTLINTPYQDGGIYCNGIYLYSGDPNYCQAITPQIVAFNFARFSVSVRFKVTERINRPVFNGGDSYRWIGFYLRGDGTVAMEYNNTFNKPSQVQYSLNAWHEATVTYDSASSTGAFYLDGAFAGSAQFQLIHGNDKNMSITNTGYSNYVFRGILSDLRIYSTVLVPTEVGNADNVTPEKFELQQNYPNPFNPSTTIRFEVPKSAFVSLKIFNVMGAEISSLVNERRDQGSYQVQWNAVVPSGVYFYRLLVRSIGGEQTGAFVLTKRMLVIK